MGPSEAWTWPPLHVDERLAFLLRNRRNVVLRDQFEAEGVERRVNAPGGTPTWNVNAIGLTTTPYTEKCRATVARSDSISASGESIARANLPTY